MQHLYNSYSSSFQPPHFKDPEQQQHIKLLRQENAITAQLEAKSNQSVQEEIAFQLAQQHIYEDQNVESCSCKSSNHHANCFAKVLKNPEDWEKDLTKQFNWHNYNNLLSEHFNMSEKKSRFKSNLDPTHKKLLKQFIKDKSVRVELIAEQNNTKPIEDPLDNQRSLFNQHYFDAAIKYYQEEGIVVPFQGQPKVINRSFVLAKASGDPRVILDARMANHFFGTEKFIIPTHMSILAKPATVAVKFDLKSAFLHFDTHQDLQPYLCFRGPRSVVYTWKKLPFGTVMAPLYCQKIMEPIIQIMRDKHEVEAYVYYDDIIMTSKSEVHLVEASRRLQEIFQDLNINVNYEKSTIKPVSEIDWLGMRVIMDKDHPHKISIENTAEKRRKVKYLATMLNPNKKANKKTTIGQLLQFIGVASFMAQVTKGARWYINVLLALYDSSLILNRRLHNTEIKFHKIRGIVHQIVALCCANVNLTVDKHDKSLEVYVDASDFAGGVSSPPDRDGNMRCASFMFSDKIWDKVAIHDTAVTKWMAVDGQLTGVRRARWDRGHIMVKETYVVLEVLKAAPKNCSLRIFCDSQTTIAAIAKGTCKNAAMNTLVQLIWRVARKKQIQFVLAWVKSENNLADAPSRNPQASPKIPTRQIGKCFAKAASVVTRKELINFATTKFFFHDQEHTSTMLEAKLKRANKADAYKTLIKRRIDIYEQYSEFSLETKIYLAQIILWAIAAMKQIPKHYALTGIIVKLVAEDVLRQEEINETKKLGIIEGSGYLKYMKSKTAALPTFDLDDPDPVLRRFSRRVNSKIQKEQARVEKQNSHWLANHKTFNSQSFNPDGTARESHDYDKLLQRIKTHHRSKQKVLKRQQILDKKPTLGNQAELPQQNDQTYRQQKSSNEATIARREGQHLPHRQNEPVGWARTTGRASRVPRLATNQRNQMKKPNQKSRRNTNQNQHRDRIQLGRSIMQTALNQNNQLPV